jgi:calcineurin-like phosphoesterase family protein
MGVENMSMFFTGDTHFNHRNILRYCNRPFSDTEEMNEILIKGWNSRVGQDDVIYCLGDLGMGQLGPILQRLNGEIYLIPGSHDKNWSSYAHYFIFVSPLIVLDRLKTPITLCHYAMRTWYKSHFNTWHLFAHSHGCLEPIGKSWDIGVDTEYQGIHRKYCPYSLEEIAEIMKLRPDNPDLLQTKKKPNKQTSK